MNYFYKNTLKPLAWSLLLVAGLFSSINASAQESLAIGPDVGTKAPEITVINQQKKQETIASLSDEKGLILVFFRSADWCPFCKKHLIEFNQEAEKLKSLGYGLAAVSYDSTEILNSFSSAQKISYPLLSDQQAKTMISYGILNQEYPIGSRNYGIPYPGVVVINKAGDITQKYFFHGYKKRAKFTELYTQLTTPK